MAGDWIKMRTDLYRDPKVCIIADYLISPDGELAKYVNQNCRCDMAVTRNVMRNVTVGALVTLWGVTRHRGKRNGDDLLVRNATISICDDIADLPGLGAALEVVGWVVQKREGVVFPRFFEEFNVDPADDAKAKAAERQKRYRQKRNVTRDATVTSQSNARVEKSKSRVEKNKKEEPALEFPKILDSVEFRKSWDEWRQHLREKNTKTTPSAIQKQLNKCAQMGPQRAIAAIDNSIAGSWQSIYESKDKPSNSNGTTPTETPRTARVKPNDFGD